jgi:AraC family transcriptional regulator
MDHRTVMQSLEDIGATRLRQADLGDGLGLAQWQNRQGRRIAYAAPGHHTISLYLGGAVRRLGQGSGVGSTGVLCLVPAEGESYWQVVEDTEFCHLYISRERFQRFAAEVFDRDGRTLTLPDRSFLQDPLVAEVVNRAILPNDWSERGNRLLLEQAGNFILTSVLRTHGSAPRPDGGPLTGGLAPHVLRRVQDAVETDPGADHSIDALAALAGLSPYHFARMFRISTGQTPHRWVLEQRLIQARDRLTGGGQSITALAAELGFSSPAHFAARFRARFGLTPSALRPD